MRQTPHLGALELAALLLHEVIFQFSGFQLHVLAPVANLDLALVALEALHLLARVEKLHLAQLRSSATSGHPLALSSLRPIPP